MQFTFLCVTIGTACVLTSTYSKIDPYDFFVVDLIFSFVLTIISLAIIQKYRPSFFKSTDDSRGAYNQIPLNDLGDGPNLKQKERASITPSPLSTKKHIALILFCGLFLAVRIELDRRISRTAQCKSRSYTAFLPLLLSIYECRRQPRLNLEDEEEDPESTAYDAITQKLKQHLIQPVWRYVPSTIIVTWACYRISGLWLPQNSTYICPIGTGASTLIPKLQQTVLVLDAVLVLAAGRIARSSNSGAPKALNLPNSLAITLVITTFTWVLYAIIWHKVKREEMRWLFAHDTASISSAFWRAFRHATLLCVLTISTAYSVVHYGAFKIVTFLIACVACYSGISNLLSVRHPFPPNTSTCSVWVFIALYLGIWSLYRIAQTVGQLPPTKSSAWQSTCFMIFLFVVFFGFWKSNGVHFHPIELLMFDAKTQHEQYIKYASASTNLRSAVEVYEQRYQNNPPPGFDVWYEYARSRSVLITDDYDQIYKDLLPFAAVSPADLRKRTWDMVSNPWNEISGISIRNGRAELQENVLPTHRWMLEGVAVLINSFAEHLPDMDLAFNLNDESRVAVPYAKMSSIRDQALQTKLEGKSLWTSNRTSDWLPVATEAYTETVFENWSFRRNFRRFGSVGCPPNSLAITKSQLTSQSHICMSCVEPHSMSQFVSNWTLAADICHQPDLATLHGFYLASAAFKTTYELMPVFSQSKAGGYNDILYPSSWNYMDKVVYQPINATGAYGTDEYSPGYPDPTFEDKQNKLYWRGATSEGISAMSGAWQGMTRQRLVHMANNATSDSDHDRVTVLLADPNSSEKYRYHSLKGPALQSLGLQQSTDIHFVNNILRCGGKDCDQEKKEFALVPPVNFQAHWRYRFLFDMDGAAFSGRFLPFLQSHSLPFKTALFREWYDSRITAWRHFVPVDIRLHGMWSTLAYFAGVDGTWPGSSRRYKWEAHTAQAEIIAEEGREWAGKVLRKEDMEVYFFRLLLEWARLTDDRRNELGFALS